MSKIPTLLCWSILNPWSMPYKFNGFRRHHFSRITIQQQQLDVWNLGLCQFTGSSDCEGDGLIIDRGSARMSLIGWCALDPRGAGGGVVVGGCELLQNAPLKRDTSAPLSLSMLHIGNIQGWVDMEKIQVGQLQARWQMPQFLTLEILKQQITYCNAENKECSPEQWTFFFFHSY